LATIVRTLAINDSSHLDASSMRAETILIPSNLDRSEVSG